MKTDTLSRRLRFAPPNPTARPKKAAKNLILTEADFLVFEAIHRHGPLPSPYLFAFAKRQSLNAFQHRLTEFYNGDDGGPYLTRPEQQHAGFEARYQHLVYDLAPRARRALAARGIAAPLPRRDAFLHQLMQACVGASIELSVVSKGIRYISRDEILNDPRCGDAKVAKNPMAIELHGLGNKETLIPDDLFGLQLKDGKYLFFAVEVDRNTESIERRNLAQSSFGRKVACYMQVLRERRFKDWWGLPNLTILTVTTNKTHEANLLDHIRKQGDAEIASRFVITTDTDFGPNWRVPRGVLTHLFDKPWTTVSGEKRIDRP